MQRFSGCDEALLFSLRAHSGEVSSNELIHLDEEVANNNHINWGGLAICHGFPATEMEARQGCLRSSWFAGANMCVCVCVCVCGVR